MSDIDLLVDFEEGRSLFDLIALKQDLEDMLGSEVDVVTNEALHWYIREQVMNEAVPFVGFQGKTPRNSLAKNGRVAGCSDSQLHGSQCAFGVEHR